MEKCIEICTVGDSIRCKHAHDIIDQINHTVNQWKTFADEVKVDPQLRDEIDRTILDLGTD
ncbi:hypothetical protein [Aquiflexum sp.]|uniref:hypothetical protein n=1 Tax=Aquiflexum sp. TaxID=1872584 RepID=UPI003593B415